MGVLKYLKNRIEYEFTIRRFKKSGRVIKYPSYISSIENIVLGENVYIGPDSIIMAKGGLSVGNNVRIGPRVSIWTENHNYKSETMLPYDNNDIPLPVIIESNVWIGLGAIICPGTILREGSIVAMGSVVRGEIKSCSIVGGNPAREIGSRDPELYKMLVKHNSYHKL